MFNIFRVKNKKKVYAIYYGKFHNGVIVEKKLFNFTVLFDGSTLYGTRKYKTSDFNRLVFNRY